MREAGFDAAIRRRSAHPHFLFTFWYYIKKYGAVVAAQKGDSLRVTLGLVALGWQSE